MKGTVYILHGCPSDEEHAMKPEFRTYDKHWIPWAKDHLIKRGYKVITPMMPNPWAPDYTAFKNEFEKNKITENDVLIGHSCGGTFLVRWLGDSKQKINRLILVAPWKITDKDDEFREKFYDFEIDRTIPERAEKIIMFTSDNEEEDGKKSLKLFHDALGGDVVELLTHGHFTFGDMGTEEFPELLEAVG